MGMYLSTIIFMKSHPVVIVIICELKEVLCWDVNVPIKDNGNITKPGNPYYTLICSSEDSPQNHNS
jgi:hypothetical protein